MKGMLQRATIFLGAFLLFLVQPMLGNTLLPVFGGTATVWSVCLAVFQALLVVGYWYAHFLGRGARRGSALMAHCALLLALPGLVWAVSSHRAGIFAVAESMPPALGVLVSVVFLAAVPYALLSANSTLVQCISGGRYGLYSVSNLGSLLGLWAYPLLFERFMGLGVQWCVFAVLCLAYAVLFACLVLACRETSRVQSAPVPQCAVEPPRAAFSPWRCLALSALSCFLLNAVSTHLGLDITPLPLLWVALLSLYLLSYVVGFTERASRFAPLAGLFLVPLSMYAAWHMGLAEFRHFKMEMLVGASVLFLGGFVVHSGLYSIRPGAKDLTRYYLMIALGGAAGGAVCSFLMPLACDRVLEYPIAVGLTLAVGLAAACGGVDCIPACIRPSRLGRRNGLVCATATVCCVGLLGMTRIGGADGSVLKRYRNFYGTGIVAHRAIEVSSGQPYEANEFRCNGTTHGFQVLTGRWAGTTPTVYYAEHAGGLPFMNHRKAKSGEAVRAGLCGMGIGTLASYARPGDVFRFYEINPDVAGIAKDAALFSFVSDSRGSVDVVIDDARRALERERAAGEPKFDILVVDVFTGDAIPPHMVTREAFQLYLDRLAPDGILAFHLSNWHLDLMPMVKAAAKALQLKAEAFYCASTQIAFESTWAFLSRNDLPAMFDARCHSKVDFTLVPNVDLMTDERHSLLPYIRWNVN